MDGASRHSRHGLLDWKNRQETGAQTTTGCGESWGTWDPAKPHQGSSFTFLFLIFTPKFIFCEARIKDQSGHDFDV